MSSMIAAIAAIALGCDAPRPLAPAEEHRPPTGHPGAITMAHAVSGSVDVTPDSLELVVGREDSLRAVVRDARGRTVRKASIAWTTDDSTVATVGADGVVRGVAPGETWAVARSSYGTDRSRLRVVAPPAAPSCDAYPAVRDVPVAGAPALHDALRTARAGDRIRLADGVYAGRFTLAASGTTEQPIVLCGTRAAVLDGGSVSTGNVVTLTANHWILDGFSIRNGVRGVLAERASDNVLRGLDVSEIGQEAIHIRIFSSRNVVERSVIHRTGRVAAEWGEGVYLGSWTGHWCTFTACEPDRSDGNQVLDNVFGPGVTAEHVDAKEGTSGGVVRGNTFDGTGMVLAQDWIDSWVLVQGNGYTIAGNRGSRSLRHGFETEVMVSGWGNDNRFTDNVADVGASGYGFLIRTGTFGNVVSCTNTVTNAGSGYSNVGCR